MAKTESSKKSSDSRQYIRLAIPNKGRISEPINELLEKSGISILNSGNRTLIAKTRDPDVDILYARPIDIPEYVASGVADIGITGRDMVLERGSSVREILKLGFGIGKIVLAVMDESGIKSVSDLINHRVSTEFPAIAKQYFKEKKVQVKIVPVGGACEVTPHLGIADAIIDITSSGTTLQQNKLRIIDTVLETETLLIGNNESCLKKSQKLNELHLALESVINARGKCYLMMNVHRDKLEEIQRIIPGMAGPTVMDVASEKHMVAVHAVVDSDQVYALISTLKQSGAQDILVMGIERMIR